MALPPERSSSFLLSSRRRAHNIFNNFSHEKHKLHALKKLSQKLYGEINLIVTEEGRGGSQEEGDDASMNICFIN